MAAIATATTTEIIVTERFAGVEYILPTSFKKFNLGEVYAKPCKWRLRLYQL